VRNFKFKFIERVFAVLLAFLIIPLNGLADSFSDVPADAMYSPHIQRFLDQNFIFGETNFGQFAGTFRPADPITRAEYAKLSAVTRLAEQYGSSGRWNTLTKLGLVEAVDSKLKAYYQCASGSCSRIGNKPFSDVQEKSPECLEESLSTSTLCEPWYSQYVYYLVDKGHMDGFEDGSGEYFFFPDSPLSRLEALEVILLNSPTASLSSDRRFQRLTNTAVSRGSLAPKCLEGAENYILDFNGGDTSSANRLLSLAMLADRLDLFGSDCSAFSSQDPLVRAAYLVSPLTRQEAPRFFALTTSYSPLQPDPRQDPTVNDADENEGSPAGNGNYQPPPYHPTDVLNNGGNNGGNNGNGNNGNNNNNSNNYFIIHCYHFVFFSPFFFLRPVYPHFLHFFAFFEFTVLHFMQTFLSKTLAFKTGSIAMMIF